MKTAFFQKLRRTGQRILAFFINPRLLLCLGIGWMITNGWCYLFLFFGLRFGIGWMAAVGGAYAAFLWFPFTPEKIVTVAIALFLLRLFFPHDRATLAVLQEEGRRAREAFAVLRQRRLAKKTARRMRRAMIVGCPGSGKSRFARALAERTGLPLIYLDRLYWRPDRTTVTPEEFDRRLAQELAAPAWIIDGNYQRTLRMRLAAADTVFFLDYPPELCLRGLSERRGKPRPDLPWVEEEPDEAFLAFVRAFPHEGRKKLLAALKGRPKGLRLVTFRTRAEADAFLAAWPASR